MKSIEEWKPVIGYERYYEVSSIGRVRAKERKRVSGGVERVYKRKVLKTPANSSGYMVTTLVDEHGNKKNMSIHRLVAEMFVPNIMGLPFVNHKDANKLNNDMSNLEWVTPQQNTAHAIKAGVFNPRECSKKKQIVATHIITGEKVHYESVSAAIKAGYHPYGIISSCKGTYSKHKLYKWDYI